jgi:hypothetical protein
VLGDCEHDHRLLVGVKADVHTEPPELVGEDSLELGVELFHAGIDQGPRGRSADTPFGGDGKVQEIMDVHVRVAGNGSVEQVGLAAGALLDRQRRPRRMVAEADPADHPGTGAVLPAGALARPAGDVGDVPHALSLGRSRAFQIARSRPALRRTRWGG